MFRKTRRLLSRFRHAAAALLAASAVAAPVLAEDKNKEIAVPFPAAYSKYVPQLLSPMQACVMGRIAAYAGLEFTRENVPGKPRFIDTQGRARLGSPLDRQALVLFTATHTYLFNPGTVPAPYTAQLNATRKVEAALKDGEPVRGSPVPALVLRDLHYITRDCDPRAVIPVPRQLAPGVPARLSPEQACVLGEVTEKYGYSLKHEGFWPEADSEVFADPARKVRIGLHKNGYSVNVLGFDGKAILAVNSARRFGEHAVILYSFLGQNNFALTINGVAMDKDTKNPKAELTPLDNDALDFSADIVKCRGAQWGVVNGP